MKVWVKVRPARALLTLGKDVVSIAKAHHPRILGLAAWLVPGLTDVWTAERSAESRCLLDACKQP